MKKEEKQVALNALKDRYQNCMACPLATQGRTQVVFGTGNSDSQLVIIGEAPGADEDKQGAPFVGRAGKLLTSMLQEAGFVREELYISNVAKCRPPQNRPPTTQESSTCSKILLFQEIKIIKPKVICTLGATATQSIMGPETKISAVRGNFYRLKEYLIVPTYHPAYILRDPSKRAIVVADLNKIRIKIELLNAE